jgi:hypothetical protein
MPDFRIAHLAIWQANRRARCQQAGIRAVFKQLIKYWGFGLCYGIMLAAMLYTESIQYT